MSGERPWARHFMDEWQSRAGDSRLPYWLRVTALAYGSHTDNGHARFKRGEIALILGHVDPTSGEVVRYVNVSRAIDDAVTYGWLSPDSFWGRLIVPAHAIRKGAWDTPKPCPIHVKRKANHSLTEWFSTSQPTPNERFSDVTAQSLSGSERAPLFLICPPNHDETAADNYPNQASA